MSTFDSPLEWKFTQTLIYMAEAHVKALLPPLTVGTQVRVKGKRGVIREVRDNCYTVKYRSGCSRYAPFHYTEEVPELELLAEVEESYFGAID